MLKGEPRLNCREDPDQCDRSLEPQEVSWYQRKPASLALISASRVHKNAGIIDVGGGASTLVDFLLDAGYTLLAVLDPSGSALQHSQARLGFRAAAVDWFESEPAEFDPPYRFGLWHDRALFHFLMSPDERRQYLAALRRTLVPGGTAIISTLALDGPPTCDYLDLLRHDEQTILKELGDGFELQEVRHETHMMPCRSELRYIYFRLRWQRG